MLVVDEKTKKYRLPKPEIPVIPDGNQMAPQDRLGKDRLGKVSSKEERSKAPVKKVPNPDIDELITFLKETLGLKLLDGSDKMNRRFAWLALKKFKDKETIKSIIQVASQNDFWKNKITDFKGLYYQGVKIASSINDKQKQKWSVI